MKAEPMILFVTVVLEMLTLSGLKTPSLYGHDTQGQKALTKMDLERIATFKSLRGKPRIEAAFDALESIRIATGIAKTDPKSARKDARDSLFNPSKIPLDKERVIQLFGTPDHVAKALAYAKGGKEREPTVPCERLVYYCGQWKNGNQFNIVFEVLEQKDTIIISIDAQSILLPHELQNVARGLPDSKAPLYKKIIAKIVTGELKPEKDGYLILPKDFSGACVESRALATKRDDGQWLIVFRYWSGRHDNMIGFLYSTKNLAESDWVKSGKEVTIRVGRLDVQRHASLDKKWYLVGYHMD